jgi:hypothetical protein
MLADLLPDTVGARVHLRRNRDLERRIEAFNFLPTRIDEWGITLARMAPNHVVLVGAESARREPVQAGDKAAIRILD